MINPIGFKDKLPPTREKTPPLPNSFSNVSTFTSCKIEQKESLSFFQWLFYPLITLFNWIISIWCRALDRIALSTYELELFEELLEGAFWGGALYFYELDTGKKTLEKVIQDCGELYDKLTKKWFPNVEGILFMRISLLKIKMRAHASLDQKSEVENCKKLINSLGFTVPEPVELQTEILLTVSQSRYRKFIRTVNYCVKACAKFFLWMKK